MIRFIYSILEIILEVIASLFEGVITLIVAAVPSKRNREYEAHFIPTGSILTKSEKGFCLTGDKSLTIIDSYSNVLILGGSGSGKSSRILIPSILNMAGNSSLIIHDPSGELHHLTSGAMKKFGYDIKVLNYSRPGFSEGYNPLHRVRSTSDIGKVSKLLVYTTLGASKDPFWNTAAENLITIFIKYVIEYASENRTMSLVLNLINQFSSNPDEVDILMVKTHDAELLKEYKALVANESKALQSVIMTARTALSLFADPSIAEVTKTDTISFEQFRRQKTILYINNSVADMRYYSSISSIFFEQFFGSIMRTLPQKEDMPVFFLLDEASSLYLNLLPTAISNIRKYRSGIMQIYQHYNQIVDLYGPAQARNIAANSYAKVYMKGVPLETAKELEAILGRYEYIDEEGVQKTRQLLTADEIRLLNKSIILCGNNPPILATMVPYYEQASLKKLAGIPPYISHRAESAVNEKEEVI